MDTEDVSTEFLFKLWPWLEANKNRLIGFALGVVLIALVYSFIAWHRGQNEIAAGQAFTQLIFSQTGGANPSQQANSFLDLASNYAGTEAAQRADLQAASILFASGNYADAQTQFEKFADAHSGPLAAIATLGMAASLEALGKPDQAAAAYEKLSANHTSPAAYMQAEYSLGRLAEQGGNLTEAETHYENAAQLGRAGGTISEEAQGRAYEIKMKLSATQKTTTSNSILQ